ncbi:hypothetical protein QQF64_026420 [Cirrhinus molitorella]|uniref:Uncharacterized protein n=1 Tax=Cirrhinus molitorella TaxID=172907 RepID=A0ABR3NA46_9TELE
MRVPVRRLAGLWPWLLMAALQVVLGHTGLELAAAVESERSAAMIKVSLLKQEPTSRPITLEGVFAGGSAGYAEGKLMQCYKSSSATVHGSFASVLNSKLSEVKQQPASLVKCAGLVLFQACLPRLSSGGSEFAAPQVGERRYPNLTGFSGPVGGSQAEQNKIRHDDGGNVLFKEKRPLGAATGL